MEKKTLKQKYIVDEVPPSCEDLFNAEPEEKLPAWFRVIFWFSMFFIVALAWFEAFMVK